MKRILTLSLIFSLISTFSFAQIRIEKRRYNKGWYVSLNHKKNSSDEKPAVKSKSANEKKLQAEPVAVAEEKPAAELQAVADNKNVPLVSELKKEKQQQSATKKPVAKMHSVAAPAAKQIKNAVAAPIKMQQSFARNAKSKATAKADPGDNFYSFIGGKLGDALLFALVAVGALMLIVYLLGLILNPGAMTIVGAVIWIGLVIFENL